jgi:hypothetical protein
MELDVSFGILFLKSRTCFCSQLISGINSTWDTSCYFYQNWGCRHLRYLNSHNDIGRTSILFDDSAVCFMKIYLPVFEYQ